MKESILIQNIGPLREVYIEDIKTITLLIGESASGKSTLLKVLILMRYLYKMLNIRTYLKHAKISTSPFRLRIDKLLSDELKEALNGQSVIEYKVQMGEREYCIRHDGSQRGNKKWQLVKQIAPQDLIFFKEAFVAETRNLIPQWQARGSSVRGKALDFYFQETFDDFMAATAAISEQKLGHLGFTMSVRRTTNGKQIYIAPQDNRHAPIKLQHASSGIQNSASLLTNVRYFSREFSFQDAFKRSVLHYLLESDKLAKFSPSIEWKDLPKHIHIHIEEPEISLYPEAQRALLDEMVREVCHRPHEDGRQVGVMMATHSPYLLNQLNVLLEASYHEEGRAQHPYLKAEEVAVYHLVDGEARSLMGTDDETGRAVIETYLLSETMQDIADSYFRLRGGDDA